MQEAVMHLFRTVIAVAVLASPAMARTSPDEMLAVALRGRVAGPAVDCISLPQARSSKVIDGTAIIYRVGGTLYVNRPRAGADALNDRDIMVVKQSSHRLCSIDTVELYDRDTRALTGAVFLGDFVPYRRAAG